MKGLSVFCHVLSFISDAGAESVPRALELPALSIESGPGRPTRSSLGWAAWFLPRLNWTQCPGCKVPEMEILACSPFGEESGSES